MVDINFILTDDSDPVTRILEKGSLGVKIKSRRHNFFLVETVLSKKGSLGHRITYINLRCLRYGFKISKPQLY